MQSVLCVIMPDMTSPTCVASDGNSFFACGGIENKVYVFRPDGRSNCSFCTARPYRYIRYEADSAGYTALGSSCSSPVFILNGYFEEQGLTFTSAVRSHISACWGGDGYIGSVYDSSVTISDMSGSVTDVIFRAPAGRSFIDYADYGTGYALAWKQSCAEYIKAGGETVVLPPCVSFRNFIPLSSDVYAVVSVRYIYTYIIRIVSGGAADLSALYGSKFLGGNMSGSCCNNGSGMI